VTQSLWPSFRLCDHDNSWTAARTSIYLDNRSKSRNFQRRRSKVKVTGEHFPTHDCDEFNSLSSDFFSASSASFLAAAAALCRIDLITVLGYIGKNPHRPTTIRTIYNSASYPQRDGKWVAAYGLRGEGLGYIGKNPHKPTTIRYDITWCMICTGSWQPV